MHICDSKIIQFMPASHSNTNRVIIISIPSAKTLFQNIFVVLNTYMMLSLVSRHKRYDFNVVNFRRHSH